MRSLLLCVFAGVLLFSTGCGDSGKGEVEAAVKSEKERRPAPPFSLKDGEGKDVSLGDYRGKVVLLNFWATWCGPCKIEIPWFVEFQQKYKDRGFAVLGVSMDEEGWEVIKPYLEKNPINYRILLGTDMVAEQYGGVDSLPTTFLIDTEGRIASTHVGLVSKSEYEKGIQELLDKRAANGTGAFAAVLANKSK